MDILKKTDEFVLDCGIDEFIKNSRGILVAYSGGADSSLLLHYLVRRYGCEKISACHVNHMIRGLEADSDEDFCRETCKLLEVQFFSKKINIPEIAKNDGLGVEEAARRERYKYFSECADGRLIATAHNATDNLETVVFNLCRGSGLAGLGGIAPVRDGIIRPLLSLTSEEVRDACHSLGISFVTDSTNLTCDYTRNYIRHEIVPRLRKINESCDTSALRCSRIARTSFEYIESEGQKLIESDNFIYRENFIKAKKPVAISALRSMYKKHTGTAEGLSEVHLEDVYRLAASKNSGELSMPHKFKFILQGGKLSFGQTSKKEFTEDSFILPLDGKIHSFGEHFAVCAVKGTDTPVYDENIYNLFIKHSLAFDKIDGSILIRRRHSGDKILSGNLHKKLKKLMCDKKIPESIRDALPIFCDNSGIIVAPGIALRDCAAGKDINLFVFRRKGNL